VELPSCYLSRGAAFLHWKCSDHKAISCHEGLIVGRPCKTAIPGEHYPGIVRLLESGEDQSADPFHTSHASCPSGPSPIPPSPLLRSVPRPPCRGLRHQIKTLGTALSADEFAVPGRQLTRRNYAVVAIGALQVPLALFLGSIEMLMT